MTTQRTTAADEIKAMQRIAAILDKLDHGAQTRVLVWLDERYTADAEHAATSTMEEQ